MNRHITVPLLVLLGLGMIACSGPQRLSQLQIGAWAAEHDLWDEAIYRWTRAAQANPGSAAAHNNLAVAYEKKGRMEEARREYELALKLAPKNSYIKANFGRFKLNMEVKEDKLSQKKKDKDEVDKSHEIR